MSQQQFLGKYRGKVVNPVDPMELGRIIALVPAVSEIPLTWALPSVPYAGPDVGFFAVPPPGANVWIEFEGGDPNFPIWSGCFWGEGQVPAEPAVPTTIMLKTTLGSISINNLEAELKLELIAPDGLMSMTMSPAGVNLSLNEVTISMTMEAITLSHSESNVAITPEAIGLTNAEASVEVTPAAISLANGEPSVEVTPAAISVENGAGSVVVSPASVTINEGALEII